MKPLSALFQALEAARVHLDVEVVLDALSLASAMTPADEVSAGAQPGERLAEGAATQAAADDKRPGAGAAAPDETPAPTRTPVSADRVAARPIEGAYGFSRVRLPRAAGLAGERGIPGALRPLRRKTRSARAPIDEAATVQRATEDDLWLPIHQRVAERWLELALVVDAAVSMTVWQEVARELRKVFTRSAAFRDVRMWSLASERDPIGVLAFSPRRGTGPTAARMQSPFGGGRRGLVLVVSDCVSGGWYDGRVLSLLQKWSRESPVALLQVLPERMWGRTALGEATRVRLRAVSTAMTNPHLHWQAELPLPEAGWRSQGSGVGAGLALFPIVRPDPQSLRRLALMVAGTSDDSIDGALFEIAAQQPAPSLPPADPDKRVRQFWNISSSAAVELASLLSAAPVQSTGVLSLLRRELLPASDPSVEAEVLFGGLVSVPKALDARDGDVPLEFQPGIRSLLLENAPVDRVFEVLRSVAAHTTIPGISTATFESWIANPSASEEALYPGTDPAAAQVASVLEQIGGQYARLVHPDARRGPAVAPSSTPKDAAETAPAAEASAEAASRAKQPGAADTATAGEVRVLRIFVSSAGDTAAERASLTDVIERLNATSARIKNAVFELILWEDQIVTQDRSHWTPSSAQRGTEDVYLGIVHGRAAGGVEAEFDMALDAYKRSGRPKILMYVNETPFPATNLSEETISQWTRARQFKERLKQEGPVNSYQSLGEFRQRVARDLAGVLDSLAATTTSAPTGDVPTAKRTCFVISAFGRKTDFATGRTLNVDLSYYDIIKPTLQALGIESVRSDEMSPSIRIDRLEYEQLLKADLVVADLSTANAGVIYQLGVRHALRPATTIVIAEREFRPFFDLANMVIFGYTHLGDAIDYAEVMRARDFLRKAIQARAENRQQDSPVFTFLPLLKPPFENANFAARPLSSPGDLADGAKRTCFVTMGFGEKTDFATGRTLDLDLSYRMIRQAVEEMGIRCFRADEIVSSGTIDKPLYESLFEADIVVADLSTSNMNALYELGVRHGLRPHTTIVMAEREFKSPFDFPIFQYEHLGRGIDEGEARRVGAFVTETIERRLRKPEIDSPVYISLPELLGGGSTAPA